MMDSLRSASLTHSTLCFLRVSYLLITSDLYPSVMLCRQVVVVGAHMDSLPTGATARGAVDNGSGTVALLVLAKAFAKHSWNRTIEFVAFGAEEQGIHGSA